VALHERRKTLDGPSIEFLAGGLVAVFFGMLAVAATSGLNALGELRLRALSETEGKLAVEARRVLARLPLLRTRLLVLRVVNLVALAVISTVWAFSRYELVFAALFLGLATLSYGVSAELASSLARRRPQMALRLLKLVRPFELLMSPLAWPIHLISMALDRLLPVESAPVEERLAELEVEQILEKGEESGSIEVEHARLLWNVLEFKNTVAREVMVPRTQVVAFSVDEDVNEVARRVIEAGHSRYPIYRDKIDHIVGVLYAKDLFAALQQVELTEIGPLMRKPVFFTPESKKIGALLTEMQQRRVHLAIVVDEFGGVEGIVTLEDIVEEIVGDIVDEHDVEEPMIEQIGPGRFVVNAQLNIYDLEEALGESICEEEDGEFDSVGGLVIELAGCVPKVGETVRSGRYDLTVLEADERSVRRAEVVRAEDSSNEPQSDAVRELQGS
jgi:putative hemolysin